MAALFSAFTARSIAPSFSLVQLKIRRISQTFDRICLQLSNVCPTSKGGISTHFVWVLGKIPASPLCFGSHTGPSFLLLVWKSQKKVHLSGWITDCVHMDEFNSLVVASSGVAPAGGNGDAHNYARLPRQPHTAGGLKEDDVEGDFLQQELHHIVSHTSLASPIRRNGYTAVRHSPYKPGKSSLKKWNIQGVTCFDYDDEKGLIVSGSTDGNIRLWSPTHLAKPWMVLSGHAATIAAVCLVKQSEFLWSLSDQAVRKTQELRYWDLNQGKCVNTIQLAFSTGNKGDRVQFSCQRPLLASKHVLYVVCGDSVATVHLRRSPFDGHGPRIVEALLGRTEDSEGAAIGAESKIPYRFREDLLDFGYHGEDDVFNKFITDLKKIFADSVTATQRLKEVEWAGVKSLVKSSTEEPRPVYEWEVELAKVPAVPPQLVPLNQIKLKELEGKEIMKKHVKDGTPFCGLRLHEPTQIELPKGLPL